jgi:hypothetical protein
LRETGRVSFEDDEVSKGFMKSSPTKLSPSKSNQIGQSKNSALCMGPSVVSSYIFCVHGNYADAGFFFKLKLYKNNIFLILIY